MGTGESSRLHRQICRSLDASTEVLEDETIPSVSLEEWGKHQRLDSHELDENVEGWA